SAHAPSLPRESPGKSRDSPGWLCMAGVIRSTAWLMSLAPGLVRATTVVSLAVSRPRRGSYSELKGRPSWVRSGRWEMDDTFLGGLSREEGIHARGCRRSARTANWHRGG